MTPPAESRPPTALSLPQTPTMASPNLPGPRVLVLSSSTGTGHDMRAQAFREWMAQLRPDVEVRIEQVIENGSALGAFGVWFYNAIQRWWPGFHQVYWHFVEHIVGTAADKVSFGGAYYRQLIAAYRPHLILSVHDSTNRGYFSDARRVLGPDLVRCVTYCGEWSGGRGYSRNWVCPTVDLFCARTEEALEFAHTLGLPPGRGQVFRGFLPPAIHAEALDTPAQRSALQAELGLDPETFTVLLATGGQGANHHRRFLDVIARCAPQVQAIVVCGRNARALSEVRAWAARHPAVRLHVEGYSTRMAHLMQISHAVITRGGANTSSEALRVSCPPIFHGLGGIMPQEELTVQYFRKHGAGAYLDHPRSLEALLRRWADRGNEYQTLVESLKALRRVEDPAEVFRSWLALADEAFASGRT